MEHELKKPLMEYSATHSCVYMGKNEITINKTAKTRMIKIVLDSPIKMGRV